MTTLSLIAVLFLAAGAGERSSAVAADVRAAASADPAARLRAYVRLGSLGHVHRVPSPTEEDEQVRCAPLQGDTACARRDLAACVSRRMDPASGNCVQIYVDTLRIGWTEADARDLSRDERVAALPAGGVDTTCCHAGYPCSTGDEGSEAGDASAAPAAPAQPAPPEVRIVFVDACAGRVGWVGPDGKASEAMLPARRAQ